MRYADYQRIYANQSQAPTMITISIGIDPSPDENSKLLGASGSGSGYIKVFGKMTERQRNKFLMHMRGYAELLMKEFEAEIRFRDEWDSGQDEIDRKEHLQQEIIRNVEAP